MSYTPISKMTDDLNVISGLPNRPSDSGYNATTLKAAFDAAANAIKSYINGHTVDNEYVNGLVDELNAKLADMEADIAAFTALSIPPGTIKTDMIFGLQVTADKLSSNAVTRDKILDGEVVQGKLGPKAVQTSNIDDGAVDTAQIASGAVTFAKTFGVQKQIDLIPYIEIQETAWYLDADWGVWTAQVDRTDNTGYTDMSRMLFRPIPGSITDSREFAASNVRIGNAAANKFVFYADSKPTADIGVSCLIFY